MHLLVPAVTGPSDPSLLDTFPYSTVALYLLVALIVVFALVAITMFREYEPLHGVFLIGITSGVLGIFIWVSLTDAFWVNLTSALFGPYTYVPQLIAIIVCYSVTAICLVANVTAAIIKFVVGRLRTRRLLAQEKAAKAVQENLDAVRTTIDEVPS